jgi:hypothetical protein
VGERLTLGDLVRQFVAFATFFRREFVGEDAANLLDGVDQRLGKIFVTEMFTHLVDDSLPQCFAAFLVDRLVSKDRKFVRTGRYENQHSIALAGFVHSKRTELLLSGGERIIREFAPLNVDTYLAGRSFLRITDCLDDPIVAYLAEKFVSSHLLPISAGAAAAKASAAT